MERVEKRPALNLQRDDVLQNYPHTTIRTLCFIFWRDQTLRKCRYQA
jgi:hypothetical protein